MNCPFLKGRLSNVLPAFHVSAFPASLGITKKYRLIATELQEQFDFTLFESFKTHFE